MARALGLNEDLTEALCLAHDLGHPPFGHGGEDALQRSLEDAGGFDHNGHTLRLLNCLENPYPNFDGLNLSWETLEGLAKHNGPVVEPKWAMAEANAALDLELGSWPSLEAQVAAPSRHQPRRSSWIVWLSREALESTLPGSCRGDAPPRATRRQKRASIQVLFRLVGSS